ncbi:DnaA initiator-associating factor for replication initiation [Gammaproteobacteria bacterium]
MSLIGHIEENFYCSIELKKISMEALAPSILAASKMLVQCIKGDHKILSCGNGGSACDAQHFTAELVNRFIIERDNLPAISLTADMAVLTSIANDYAYQEVFAKQVKALGREGDILLAISTSGKSQNVIRAIQEARARKMRIIALMGGDSGAVEKLLSDADINICVPSSVTPRIQEVHILIIHCLCALLDRQLFGKASELDKV